MKRPAERTETVDSCSLSHPYRLQSQHKRGQVCSCPCPGRILGESKLQCSSDGHRTRHQEAAEIPVAVDTIILFQDKVTHSSSSSSSRRRHLGRCSVAKCSVKNLKQFITGKAWESANRCETLHVISAPTTSTIPSTSWKQDNTHKINCHHFNVVGVDTASDANRKVQPKVA